MEIFCCCSCSKCSDKIRGRSWRSGRSRAYGSPVHENSTFHHQDFANVTFLCFSRTKIFIRFPKTLFATEDAFQARKHDLGMKTAHVTFGVYLLLES